VVTCFRIHGRTNIVHRPACHTCCFQLEKRAVPDSRTLSVLNNQGNYSATSNNTKLVHWPLMGGLLHLVQRGGAWPGCGPAQAPPRCTKCNSPPPSTASVPITVLLYDVPLLCGFNAAIKGSMNLSVGTDLQVATAPDRRTTPGQKPSWVVIPLFLP